MGVRAEAHEEDHAAAWDPALGVAWAVGEADHRLAERTLGSRVEQADHGVLEVDPVNRNIA